MSKNNICVYPSQCSFPGCNCDQPHRAKKYDPVENNWNTSPNSGIAGVAREKAISSSTDFITRYGIKSNPFDDRYKEFGNVAKDQRNPPSNGPSETPDNRNTGPVNSHGCSYVDCNCTKPCTSTPTNRERFVFYVGVQGLSVTAASVAVEKAKADLLKSNPKENESSWIFVGDRGSFSSRIERLS